MFLLSAGLLIWNNQVAWNRNLLLLRLAIIVVRDLPMFSLLTVQNSTIKFVLMLLQTYGKSPEDTAATRLTINVATTRPAEDLHHHYLFTEEMPSAPTSYSSFELLSLLVCMLTITGRMLLPKKTRKIETALLWLYPVSWLAVYCMLDRPDTLQLQAYGYLTAEVLLILR